MRKHPSLSLHSNVFYTILVIGFIFTLQATLPVYIGSSFLGQYMNEDNVGLVYTFGAVLTIIGFLSINRILAFLGNRLTTLWLTTIQILIFAGILMADAPWAIAALFVAQTAVIAMIGINFDVFVEAYSETHNVGRTRGLYLTIMNAAWIFAPLIGGSLVDGNQYKRVFLLAFGLLFLLFYLIQKNFTHFHDPKYPHASIWHTLKHVSSNSDLSKVFSANIILQIFYAWMVVYMPVYLHNIIGFSWEEIGIIFTIMLLPFVIFQLPLGRFADKYWGEKEIMTAGFVVLGISTYMLAYITDKNIWIWSVALFLTRVGASAVEVMIETYFFKKVTTKESNVLSVFRITRPLAYIITPALMAIGLYYTHYQNLLILLGLLSISAIYFTLTIRDTN